jgi:Holliday junction resolvase-like predicted endonuclease
LKKEYKEKIKNTKIIENKRALRLNLKNLKSNVSNLLIVCEVKARSKNDFGMGYEAVNATKQRNIARGAEYVLTLKEFKNMQIRFDVASVDGEKVTYLENAFTC